MFNDKRKIAALVAVVVAALLVFGGLALRGNASDTAKPVSDTTSTDSPNPDGSTVPDATGKPDATATPEVKPTKTPDKVEPTVKPSPVKPTTKPTPLPVKVKDNCPNGDYTSSRYDKACGSKPKPKTDNCPNGDYTGNRYDGKCGTKAVPPKKMDNCPNGDYTSSRYDGRCGTKPKPPSTGGGGSHNCPPGEHWVPEANSPIMGHIPAGCYSDMG